MISLKKFKNYKEVLEKNITNRAFRSRLMFEAIEDEEFANDIIKNFYELFDNITSENLNEILTKIREKTTYYFEKSNILDNFSEKLSNGLRSLAYFYFLESLNEHSTLSDNVIEKIKKKYSIDYLKIISNIDKAYLSFDTKKLLKSTESDFALKDDLLKKYVILKQWQDKQHQYYENGYGKYLEELQYKYCNDRSLNSFDVEQTTLRKRLFDSLSKNKVLDINTCSILSELYIKKYVVKYIGGKMYGLSVLNSRGIKVPYSVVVPVGVTILEKDLKKINKDFENYSIRSSADIEDGEKNSFAGMFDSYLNIPLNNIIENIDKVKNSVNNIRLKEYIKANNLEQPNMAVIIQAFKEPQYAGVWIGNSEKSGVLEWVKGNGEKLVSGTSTPNTEIWNNGEYTNSLECNGKSIGKTMLEYQRKVGTNADFEWMILDNELMLLQYRPVTKKISLDNNSQCKHTGGYFGIPASPGFVRGEKIFLSSPEEPIVSNKILLAMITDPDWLPHLMKAKGVVTAYGGFLCHTAIVCRELGIPCVTGVGEKILEELKDSKFKFIEIDGNVGHIKNTNVEIEINREYKREEDLKSISSKSFSKIKSKGMSNGEERG